MFDFSVFPIESRRDPKTALPNTSKHTTWVVRFRFTSGVPLWIRGGIL